MEQPSFGSPLGAVMQTAVVVDDIERAMEQWTRSYAVGPFFYLPHFPLFEATYRGNPTDLDIDVALAFSGSMCFELIQQNNDASSPFRNVATPHGLPLHHVAVASRLFEEDLEAYQSRGNALVASAKVGVGGRVAFLEAGPGPLLEIMELTPASEAFLSMIHAAAKSWDGRDPVRKLSP